MDLSSINYLAVLVAALVAFALGFLWHGPLFGKQWMKLSGISEKDIKAAQVKGLADMWKYMLAALIQQIIMAFVIAIFVQVFFATDVTGALQVAFFGWLGFTAMPYLSGVLWEKRTIPQYAFGVAYLLVSYVLMALILTYWQ